MWRYEYIKICDTAVYCSGAHKYSRFPKTSLAIGQLICSNITSKLHINTSAPNPTSHIHEPIVHARIITWHSELINIRPCTVRTVRGPQPYI